MQRREFLGSLAAVVAGGGLRHISLGGAVSQGLAKRVLGKTGIEVTCLALGGVVGMKRVRARDFDPAELANAAIDAGITYFDTAPAYDNGQSEKNYGEVMARRRNEVFLATKTGDRTYDGAMRSVEASLKRLQTDRVDLLQIHGLNAKEDLGRLGKPGGVYAAFLKLRDQKVTRFLGVTGHDSADVMVRAIEMYEFDTILTTFNPTTKRRPYVEKVFPVALKKNMGIQCMKVMGGGVGSLAKGNPIKNDGASNHDDAPRQATGEMLIRYALGLPITVAIVGMASVEQMKENIRAACAPPLNETERKELEKLMS